jgi:glycosyltransferase involved in cell wall biosynthesis
MHILMVAPQPFFRPRGTPFSVLHRIRALTRLGHTVELVTYPFGDSPEIAGLTIHRAARPPFVRDVGIGPSLAKLLLDGPVFRMAARLAATGRFDLLHTHEEAGWIGGRLRRTHGLTHLYDMHSSLPQQFGNFGRYNWRPLIALFAQLERYTLDRADGVIAICPSLQRHVLAAGYTGPLALIENTLDFDTPAPSAREADLLRQQLTLGDGPVVVYAGTLESYQGLDLLLAAMPEVLRHSPAARLVIVGGAEGQIKALSDLAAGHGTRDAVRFVPAVPPAEVGRYYQLADVLVTTRSKGTNTPLKVYQYLRAGRPIVATDIESHTQVLDASSAELVRPAAAAIAAGITRVLLDPQHGQRLAEGAARLARERYSEQAYMDSLSALLDSLPLRSRAPAGEAA